MPLVSPLTTKSPAASVTATLPLPEMITIAPGTPVVPCATLPAIEPMPVKSRSGAWTAPWLTVALVCKKGSSPAGATALIT